MLRSLGASPSDADLKLRPSIPFSDFKVSRLPFLLIFILLRTRTNSKSIVCFFFNVTHYTDYYILHAESVFMSALSVSAAHPFLLAPSMALSIPLLLDLGVFDLSDSEGAGRFSVDFLFVSWD